MILILPHAEIVLMDAISVLQLILAQLAILDLLIQPILHAHPIVQMQLTIKLKINLVQAALIIALYV